jgi:hypothetical protein
VQVLLFIIRDFHAQDRRFWLRKLIFLTLRDPVAIRAAALWLLALKTAQNFLSSFSLFFFPVGSVVLTEGGDCLTQGTGVGGDPACRPVEK